MDAAFDNMFDDIIDSNDAIQSIADNDMSICIGEVAAINTGNPHLAIDKPNTITVNYFDPEYNILSYDVKCRLENERVYRETEVFTAPFNTTNTLEGILSNVTFHEEQLIELLTPDEKIVQYKCNFGRKTYLGYTEPVKIRKTNRGRKKKEKIKKARKKQGMGTDFNSQVTFVALKHSIVLKYDPVTGLHMVPYESKVLKFKIFRNGKIQLTGAQQDILDDVIISVKHIADIMNNVLHSDEQDIAKKTYVVNVNPVMKNYKFVIKLPDVKHIVNLGKLHSIISMDKFELYPHVELPPDHPDINVIKFSRSDTKLSIKFATPVPSDNEKTTRVNIFMRGKVNILGALEVSATDKICEYLDWIISTYREFIIVPEGSAANYIELIPQNIESMSDEEISALHIPYMPPLPYVTEHEYLDIMRYAEMLRDAQIADADQYLEELLPGFW